MQVHVKTPHIEFTVSGDVYDPLMNFLKEEFSDKEIEILDDTLDVEASDWFKNLELTPCEIMKIHRRNLNLNQSTLGKMLGGKSKQYISDLENGRRSITLKTAKLLSSALGHHYKSYL